MNEGKIGIKNKTKDRLRRGHETVYRTMMKQSTGGDTVGGA